MQLVSQHAIPPRVLVCGCRQRFGHADQVLLLDIHGELVGSEGGLVVVDVQDVYRHRDEPHVVDEDAV